MAAAVPPSSRFLRCVRHANQASEPAEWCERFTADARTRLRLQDEAIQPGLVELILRLRPGARPDRIERLVRELDAALYGRRTLDFGRWKRELMSEVGRGAGLRRIGRERIKRAGLPALNPRPESA